MKKGMFAIAAVLSLVLVGCYGSFALTKKVYDVNGSITSNKIVHSVLMIIPGSVIYPLSMTADALILNALEFWTGSNPLADGSSLEQEAPNGNKLTATRLPGGAMEMTIVSTDGSVQSVSLIRNGDMIASYDANGAMVGQVSLADASAE
ncbi:MAG TPA: DUF3332 family protein [Fibrobacteraceae bacterium]|nr:DUF3332 family protein [Fibrobacteraceae bacterium]